MKIALAQLNSGDEITVNLAAIEAAIDEASSEKATIVFFPENAIFFRISNSDKVKPIKLDGAEVILLSDLCKRKSIAIHFTTAIEDLDVVYNASIFIDKNGVAKKLYNKIHLFDIELTGQSPIRESDSFKHGTMPVVFEYEDFKFASSICYDIRFAELYSFYARNEVDAILVPAAFLVKTGKAHWEVLLRARAIESQCYVLAPAQYGVHKSSASSSTRETYGHSMVVGPWGEVLALKKEGVGLLFVELSKDEIKKVRTQIPMRAHRRSVF